MLDDPPAQKPTQAFQRSAIDQALSTPARLVASQLYNKELGSFMSASTVRAKTQLQLAQERRHDQLAGAGSNKMDCAGRP